MEYDLEQFVVWAKANPRKANFASGPPGLPREVMDRLSGALRKVLANADVKSQFAAAGADVQPRGPQEFAAYVKADAERWSGLISKRGIKLDCEPELLPHALSSGTSPGSAGRG